MVSRKTDISMIIFIMLFYALVNVFRFFPQHSIAENAVMLAVLVVLLTISYYVGITASLISSAICLFLYGSYSFYRAFLLGTEIEYYVYFWIVYLPLPSICLAYISSSYKKINKKIEELNKNYEMMVTIDNDTKLFNSKMFYMDVSQFISFSKRHDSPLSILIVQIMYYKELLEIIGSDGMKSLKEDVAKQLEKQTRDEDCFYASEENDTFTAVLFTDFDGAIIVKNRIKANVYLAKEKRHKTMKVDLKIGVATLCEDTQDEISIRKAAEKDMEYDV